MARVLDLLGKSKRPADIAKSNPEDEVRVHTEFQDEEIEKSIKVLESAGVEAEKIEKKVEKSVQESLKSLGTESAKRIYVISRGFCPECGTKLNQHLYTNICLNCGWNSYTVPPAGPVRVHLEGGHVLEGDFCYNLKTGEILVIRQEVVVARIKQDTCQWIEYLWTDEEIRKKEEQRLREEYLTCSWCGAEATPDDDGFSIIYAAFGTYQTRYIFCSGQCQEAFRARYPSRVHRNCYETDCNHCNLCLKRFDTNLDSYQITKRARERVEAKSEEEKTPVR